MERTAKRYSKTSVDLSRYSRKKTEFGVKYTQFMVLYGNKGKAANAKAGWMVDGESDTHLTTAYIEEIQK